MSWDRKCNWCDEEGFYTAYDMESPIEDRYCSIEYDDKGGTKFCKHRKKWRELPEPRPDYKEWYKDEKLKSKDN